MGAVLKARDREVDRLVALKVIRPEFVDSHDILQRFRQELVLARQVTHPNVVRIFDLGVADGIRFISMEYIEGRELGDILQESGKLAPRSAAGIMLQVCRGLAAAHKEGVIHRDLKPQNIMVDAQGRAAIMDFGIANSVAALEVPVDTGSVALDAGPINLTRVGALLGTPRYMSPEQAKREKVDHRSDLFTFGLVLYELVSGEVPCEGNNLSELLHNRATVAIRPLRASEPGRFRQLLGDAEQVFAPLHLAPDVLGLDAGRCPQNSQVIEQVGTLADHRRRVAVDCVDHDFDSFLGKLLGHLGGSALKQPRRARRCRVQIPGRDDSLIKPFERITHAQNLIESRGQRVNGWPRNHKKIHRPLGRWIHL